MRAMTRNLSRAVRAALMPAALMLALTTGPAPAAPEGNTMKLRFGAFEVIGTYSKRSCAAQSTLRSAKGARVGFSIYWVPGRSLYLLTMHPNAGQVTGNRQVNFRFPGGQAVAFGMKRSGNNLFTNIGFGGTAKNFYKLIEANGSLRIEIPSLGDTIDVSLAQRREVEAAMRHCRDWLRS
ncbi:hypothetical protein P1J78_17380 [Psychromarinibacter sp. C21-152]|uniref:DUF2846 domain-containing protein n=1 Tax=Psychromarinibacter sediminicola TaxID=3033385 RepID=A0AAE3TA59_9RHOB|nr:hypothetical protein [Psychromarinibacter sediminicola]MDF0602513.1 hypothetical protein [Psychromarinibacter sediminicola]